MTAISGPRGHPIPLNILKHGSQTVTSVIFVKNTNMDSNVRYLCKCHCIRKRRVMGEANVLQIINIDSTAILKHMIFNTSHWEHIKVRFIQCYVNSANSIFLFVFHVHFMEGSVLYNIQVFER